MIGVAEIVLRFQGVDRQTLEVWVGEGWVRAERRGDALVFQEVDVARIQLIIELRDQLAIDHGAIPVVLSLLDQLHAARADMHRLCTALGEGMDGTVAEVVARLGR